MLPGVVHTWSADGSESAEAARAGQLVCRDPQPSRFATRPFCSGQIGSPEAEGSAWAPCPASPGTCQLLCDGPELLGADVHIVVSVQ